MSICYWCGKNVEVDQGAREHIVPKTLLQDVGGDISEFIIPKENAHSACNKELADLYEHDFCQIIFHYAIDEARATKHNNSKIRNLKSKSKYAGNQFSKMKKGDYRTEIQLSEEDRISFEKCVQKIIKGIFFKIRGKYLDLENEYFLKIIWNTFNLEYDSGAQEQVKVFLGLLGDQILNGNGVFKYRFKEVIDGSSSLWEFLFYNRFPIYLLLIHKDDKTEFRNL